MTTSENSSGSVCDLILAALPKGREDIARMMVKAFADAAYCKPQQLAALANAIEESNLEPDAVSLPEQAVGLFQLNMAHGLGHGHTTAELKDPSTNVNLILSEAAKVGGNDVS